MTAPARRRTSIQRAIALRASNRELARLQRMAEFEARRWAGNPRAVAYCRHAAAFWRRVRALRSRS